MGFVLVLGCVFIYFCMGWHVHELLDARLSQRNSDTSVMVLFSRHFVAGNVNYFKGTIASKVM